MRHTLPSSIQYSPSTSWVKSLATVALLLATDGAWGQPALDAERCASVENNPDLAIRHCTQAIDSGSFSGEDLARLHVNRGVEWAAKGDHRQAIADYDTAIRLAPKSADAHYNRGSAWANLGEPDRAIADYGVAIDLDPKEPAAYAGRAVEWTVKGDYKRAIGDFDAALRLDPKSSSAFFGRGRTRFYAGDYQRSAADLAQAHKLEPGAYVALWAYLARRRGGSGGEEALLVYAPAADDGTWPAPVIALYLGRVRPGAVIAASEKAAPASRREQRCEASFYVAQWHLARGERERALPLLKEARDRCPRHVLEYEGALAELRRLQR